MKSEIRLMKVMYVDFPKSRLIIYNRKKIEYLVFRENAEKNGFFSQLQKAICFVECLQVKSS